MAYLFRLTNCLIYLNLEFTGYGFGFNTEKVYENSKFIISKGQGNYEALSDERHTIFFLLKTKCWVIADDIGVSEGDILLKAGSGKGSVRI